jgi:hypothetical protein
VLRWIVIVLLINGLVPDLRVQVQTAVEVATAHHVLRATQESHHAAQDPEHACGPLDHHCTCCAAQPVVAPSSTVAWVLRGVRTEPPAERPALPRDGHSRRHLRPPVAA